MKLVINGCYGGFGLGHKAVLRYAKLKGFELEWTEEHGFYHYYKKGVDESLDERYFSDGDISRDDPVLIQVIEELGNEASGRCANLYVVEIPDEVKWIIKEYDGYEHVAEQHRTWS